MPIQSLFIINKSGGLVYQRDFLPSAQGKLSSNEYLILAGTLHGVVAIASQLTPKALQISGQGGGGNSHGLATGAIGGPSSAFPGSASGASYDSSDHMIPYIPGVGTAAIGAKVPGQPVGSYLAPDYFLEGFPSLNKSGLRSVVTDEFSLFVYQTLTGMKFVILSTQRNTSNTALQLADNILRKFYCIYSDYVVKNPFYSADMLIRSEPFDKKLLALVSSL